MMKALPLSARVQFIMSLFWPWVWSLAMSVARLTLARASPVFLVVFAKKVKAV